MKNYKNDLNQAPGSGSDKMHPETPSDANERFKENEQEKKVQKSSGKQSSG